MNKNLLIPLLLLPLGAIAQTSPPAQPPELRPPPNPGAWTIRYEDEKQKQTGESGTETDDASPAEASAPPKIEKVDFAINGNIARSIATYSDGTTRTAFIFGSIGVQENPMDSTHLFITDFALPQTMGGDFLRRYPGLEWVRPKFYRGIVERGDVECHHFAEGATAPPSSSSSEAGEMTALPSEMFVGNREAWISMDGRPLATKNGTETATYTHIPDDNVPNIEAPARFRAKAVKYLNALAPTNLR